MNHGTIRAQAPWTHRNRVVLLAVLPLMLLALVSNVYWVYLIARTAIGAAALFFPLALLVLPAGLGLILSLLGSTLVGLGSLGAMLWTGGSTRHWMFAAPAVLLGIGSMALWSFLRDSLAALVGAGFSVDWAAGALLAQGAFPLVVGLMTLFVLLPEREPTRFVVARGLVCIGLVWASMLSAFAPALGWARDALQTRSLALGDEISTEGNRSPIVVALCAGHLAEAAALIPRQGRALSEGDLDMLQSICLRSNTTRFFAERVGVVLDATLAWEAQGATHAPQATPGCTQHQKSLLRTVYANDFPDAALQAFVARGLPVTCPLAPAESEPLWWSIARSEHQPNVQTLVRLQAFGIDLRQTDPSGLTLVGANPNGFIANLSDASLLGLAELGLKDQPGGRSPHALVIEVMKRLHGLGAGDAATPDLLRAYARVGEPSDEQLREVLERAPWMLRAYSDTQREQEQQLRQAIERRLRIR